MRTSSLKWIDARLRRPFPDVPRLSIPLDPGGLRERFCRADGYVLLPTPDGVRVELEGGSLRAAVFVDWADVTELACFWPEVVA